MKKSLVIMFLILTIVLGVKNVCAKSSTGVINGPKLTAGSFYSTEKYDLTSPSSSSVTGHMVSADIKYKASLPSTFVANNNRRLFSYLYEQDVYPNDDELARTYTCPFSGLKILSCDVVTNDNGNLDSAGDSGVELYLKFLLMRIAGDPNSATNSFFTYNISVL